MELQTELEILKHQLNIPKDQFQRIIYTVTNNFIKKYQNKIDKDFKEVALDLKNVIRQLDIYSQFAISTLKQYSILEKLQTIVKSVIENQSSLLMYIVEDMMSCLEANHKLRHHISQMTHKVYDKCINCEKNLNKGRIDNVQAQISMKFKDLHSYFIEDIDEINKLEEEARLILFKKNLGLEGICEQVYIEKLLKMKDNMESTIYYVTSSLDSIGSFQNKLSEIQEFQNLDHKNNILSTSNKFNAKNYALNLSSYFRTQLNKLQKKIDEIKRFFIVVHTQATQTNLTGEQFSVSKIEQYKKEIQQKQIEVKQLEIQKSLVEAKLRDQHAKTDTLTNKVEFYEKQIDNSSIKIKKLQIELEAYKKKEELNRFDYKEGRDYLDVKKTSMINKQIQPKIVKQNIQERSDEDEEELRKDSQIPEDIQNENFMRANIRNKTSSVLSKKISQTSNKLGLIKRQSINPNEKMLLKKIIPTKLSSSSQYQKQSSDFSEQVQSKKKSLINIRNKNRRSTQIDEEQYLGQNSDENLSSKRKKNIQKLQFFVQFDIKICSPLKSQLKIQIDETKNKKIDEFLLLYKKYETQFIKKGIIIKFDQFKQKLLKFVEGFSSQPINFKQQLGQTILKKSLNKKSKNMKETVQNKMIEQDYKQNFNKTFKNKQSLPNTFRNKKLGDKNNLNLQQISLKNVNSLQNQLQQKRFSQGQSALMKYTNFGEDINSFSKNRYSQIIQNYNVFLQQKENMNKTSGFLKMKQTGDLKTFNFSREDQKMLFSPSEIEKNSMNSQHSGKSVARKNLISLKINEILEPVQIRFMKEFFTRLANIHVSNFDSYQSIRQFLIKPFDQSSNLNLPDLNSRGEQNKQDKKSHLLKSCINNLLVIHRNCTVKGQICKHLGYFMKKIIKLQKKYSKIKKQSVQQQQD